MVRRAFGCCLVIIFLTLFCYASQPTSVQVLTPALRTPAGTPPRLLIVPDGFIPGIVGNGHAPPVLGQVEASRIDLISYVDGSPGPRTDLVLVTPDGTLVLPMELLQGGILVERQQREVSESGNGSLSGLVHVKEALSSPGGNLPTASQRVFDGAALLPTAAPISGTAEVGTSHFLDGQLAVLRTALNHGFKDIRVALASWEAIHWSELYLDGEAYTHWREEREQALAYLNRKMLRVIRERVEAELMESDFTEARDILEELMARHGEWYRSHKITFEQLWGRLPKDDLRAEPKPPVSGPERIAERMRDHLAAGEFRQAEYMLTILRSKHQGWATSHALELGQAATAILEGTYKAFQIRTLRPSLVEARRLAEYTQALAQGSNWGFGFQQPTKQDPGSRYCTIYSIYNALKASMGFVDPTMDLPKFVELVRQILKDKTLGIDKGLSTEKVKRLVRALGLEIKVIEMQQRLKRPFQGEELKGFFNPDQMIIPVFIIAQKYADEKGIVREEHKGFLNDAYFSQQEQRWIYLLMDPLIGRTSFYSWVEMKPFLHKIFVITIRKPLATPQMEEMVR